MAYQCVGYHRTTFCTGVLHFNADFNVSETKQFLQTHVPKEVIYKSEVLLDTLLNYLMEDARKKIESGDVKLQNAFFDADFRKRIP